MCNNIPKRWPIYQAIAVCKYSIVKCDRPSLFWPHLALKPTLSHSLIAVGSLYLVKINEIT